MRNSEIRGFVKRAMEYGLTQEQSIALLTKVSEEIPEITKQVYYNIPNASALLGAGLAGGGTYLATGKKDKHRVAKSLGMAGLGGLGGFYGSKIGVGELARALAKSPEYADLKRLKDVSSQGGFNGYIADRVIPSHQQTIDEYNKPSSTDVYDLIYNNLKNRVK